MSASTYREAIRLALIQEMKRDKRVFVYGLDVDDENGIFGTTLGLDKMFGPERCFSTPLSEDAMTGVGIGAAMNGMVPVHVHTRMDFLMLCMNQLVNVAAKASSMWHGQVKDLPFVVRAVVGRSWGQGPQHSQALHSLFCHIPGLQVIAPVLPGEAAGSIVAAIRSRQPTIIMEHRLLYEVERVLPTSSNEIKPIPVRASWLDSHLFPNLTVVAVSHMALLASKIAAKLYPDVRIEVINPLWLSPLPISDILESVRKSGRLLVLDNGWLNCGLSSEIIAAVAEYIPGTKVARIGFAPFTCPTAKRLEQQFYPSVKRICDQICTMVGVPTPNLKLLQGDTFKGPF